MTLDLRRATAAQLAAAYRSGECTALATATALLDAIEGEEERLGAWLHVRREAALGEARAADARFAAARGDGAALAALPPLLGVPVALKDLVNLEGTPTTSGSKILEGYNSPYDATIAARLRAEIGRAHV